MDAVWQDTLPSTWKKCLPLVLRQAELVGDPALNIDDPLFAFSGKAEHGQHQGLVIRYRHVDIPGR